MLEGEKTERDYKIIFGVIALGMSILFFTGAILLSSVLK
jgi:hypothetical protein